MLPTQEEAENHFEHFLLPDYLGEGAETKA